MCVQIQIQLGERREAQEREASSDSASGLISGEWLPQILSEAHRGVLEGDRKLMEWPGSGVGDRYCVLTRYGSHELTAISQNYLFCVACCFSSSIDKKTEAEGLVNFRKAKTLGRG